MSCNLKGNAKELDTPIIALSQLNRGVEGREGYDGKRPQLSDEPIPADPLGSSPDMGDAPF